jgi:hypothetical protein
VVFWREKEGEREVEESKHERGSKSMHDIL